MFKKILCILLFTFLMAIPSMYHFDSRGIVLTAFVQSFSYSLLFLFLAKNIIFRVSIYTILYILFIIETFTFIFFGSRFDPNILSLILQTDFQEIKGFFHLYIFSFKSLIYFLMIILLYVFFLKTIVLSNFKIYSKRKYVNILSLLVIAGGIAIPIIPLPCQKGANTIQEVYTSIEFVNSSHRNLNEIESMMDDTKVYQSPKQEDAPIIVLIIGESFNRHHSNLYDYRLNTSPRLKKEKNLIVYNQVITPANVTHTNMRYLFTLESCNTDKADSSQYVLMPVVFKKAKYKVGYFDNQYTRSEGGVMDYSCGYFLNPKNINQNCFDYRNDQTFKYDGDFVEHYKRFFFYERKSLNIIHLMGQHLPAKMRYPDNFHFFNSSDIHRHDLDESQKTIVAEYDNATRYNDYVVQQIIDCFRHLNAVVIYLSDHGENIYDGKTLTLGRTFDHSNEKEAIENIYKIPFMIWCSDEFIANHPEKFDLLKSSSNQRFCSDDVPFLLFDLASINFNYSNDERNFISPKYQPHKTVIKHF